MNVRNSFYDSVGGIASGEGLVHVEMLQRTNFDTDKKPEFEVKSFGQQILRNEDGDLYDDIYA